MTVAPKDGSYYLLSHYNTKLYVDDNSQQLCHRTADTAPGNLILEIKDNFGRFVYLSGSPPRASQLLFAQPSGEISTQPLADFDCRIDPLSDETIGIFIDGKYVSADPDGIVRNDKSWCLKWESFRLEPAQWDAHADTADRGEPIADEPPEPTAAPEPIAAPAAAQESPDEPDSGINWFSSAQSHWDAGQIAEAARAYAKRANMGGPDEECWYARLQLARCLLKLGDDVGFLKEALAAFNQRPQRAEPLYDLARYYRERGMNDAGVIFCEAGLALTPPTADALFVDDFIYTAGLKEEYSIIANYASDPARKDRGFAACNWLALSRSIPPGSRHLARSNLFFYVQPIGVSIPSFAARPIGFTPPDNFHPSTASVAQWGEETVVVERAVNLTRGGDGQLAAPPDEPERSRNFLLRLDNNLAVQSTTEILAPVDLPQAVFPGVLGFQDLRPFVFHAALWASATIRELNADGRHEHVLARIDGLQGGACRLLDWRLLLPEGPRRDERNWMPRVRDDALEFIQACDPTRTIDAEARTVSESTPAIAAEHFNGGSQLIPFDEGWLTLIHEIHPRDGNQYYFHRFVWFDQTNNLRGVGRPFFFQEKGREFAAGLAWHRDGANLLVSYHVDDRESFIATLEASEVRRMLDDVAGWEVSDQ